VRNRTGISLLSQRRKREAESLGTFVNPLYQNFERTEFSIGNRKSKIFTSSLASTYRKKNVIRNSLHRYIGFPTHDSRFNDSRNLPSFVLFKIFHLSCLPFRKTRNGLTEK